MKKIMKNILFSLILMILLSFSVSATFEGGLTNSSQAVKISDCPSSASCTHSELIGINENYVVSKNRGEGGLRRGLIKVLNSTENYDNLSVAIPYTYSTSDQTVGSLFQLDDTIFAVAFGSVASAGYISIFNISSDFSSISGLSGFNYDSTLGTSAGIGMIDSSHILIAYTGVGSDGWLKIIEYQSGYTSPSETGSFEYNTTYATDNEVVGIDDTHALVTYRDTNSYTHAIIVTWNATYGDITQVSHFQYETGTSTGGEIKKVDNSTVIIVYTDSDIDGWIKALTWNASYDLSVISSLEFDTDYGNAPEFDMIDSTHTIIGYTGTDSDGFAKVVEWDTGWTNPTVVDTFEFDDVSASQTGIAVLDEGHAMVNYVKSYDEYARVLTWDVCETDWSCDGYASCNISDLAPCDNVTDLNTCGLSYTGDMSEFSPQACDYCTADWQRDDADCILHTRQITWVDDNEGTCCNVTGLSSDCDDTNPSSEVCSPFAYSESDLAPATTDTIVKFILAFAVFIGVAIIGVTIKWAYGKVKK